MWKLILLFTLLPPLEIFALLQIGSFMGTVPTVALILFTGVLGAWLTKREGIAVLTGLKDSLSQGIPPANQLAEGALVMAGGILLVTPGVFTDFVGFSFIIGPSRRFLAPWVLSWVMARIDVRASTTPGPQTRRPVQAPPKVEDSPMDSSPFDHPIV